MFRLVVILIALLSSIMLGGCSSTPKQVLSCEEELEKKTRIYRYCLMGGC